MNFANAAQSTLSSAIVAADVTLVVVSAATFPAAPFHIVVDQELMTVTLTAGTIFTVTRGIEGTAAVAHGIGAVVTNTVTAGDFAGFAAGGGGGGDRLVTLTNAPITKTTTFTITVYDTWYVCDTSGGAFTITLPAAAAGKMVGIRVAAASTALLTVAAPALSNIDGAATRVMWAGETAELLSDGVGWFKVAGKTIPMVCVLNNLSSPVIGTGAVIKVPMDTVVVDNTGLMGDVTVNHRVNIVRGGNYGILVVCPYLLPLPGQFQARAHKNGAGNAIVLGVNISYIANLVPAPGQSGPDVAAAGDYYELFTFHNSGRNETLYSVYVGISLTEIPSW
jgi:hypothetical protein